MKGEEKSMNLRSKSQKRQGTWKKLVSIFLVLCMVVPMRPATQLTANAAAGEVTVKAHFKNTENWSDVGIYTWGDGNPGGAWPGTKINENEEYAGWYSCEIVKDSTTKLNYIFNGSGGQTIDLALEASQFTGSVFEVWVVCGTEKNDGKYVPQIYTTPPAEWGPVVVSPETNDGNVTFRYYGKNVKSVEVSGDMNGWTKTKMKANELGVFECEMPVKPGVYKYEFIVDGSPKPDSSNMFSQDGQSVLYMPGLVGGQVDVVKGETTSLPKFLTEVRSNGTQAQTIVEYTANDADVTVSGNTVTVVEEPQNESVEILATAGDNSATVVLNFVNANDKIVSPEVSGNTVVFRSKDADSVAGSMNNWEKVAFEDGEATMYVGAGNYSYQFFTGDTASKDENNILTDGDKSRLIVPGLADAKYQAVKGRTFYLPTQLDEYFEDGSAQKVPVTYSSDIEGVEVDLDTLPKSSVNLMTVGPSALLTASWSSSGVATGTTSPSKILWSPPKFASITILKLSV